jgi:hypothetical protein
VSIERQHFAPSPTFSSPPQNLASFPCTGSANFTVSKKARGGRLKRGDHPPDFPTRRLPYKGPERRCAHFNFLTDLELLDSRFSLLVEVHHPAKAASTSIGQFPRLRLTGSGSLAAFLPFTTLNPGPRVPECSLDITLHRLSRDVLQTRVAEVSLSACLQLESRGRGSTGDGPACLPSTSD